MIANIKRLAYFERWIDPVALQMLDACPDIELLRLDYAAKADDNWQALSSVHGYQVSTRGDLQAPWFGDGKLVARCPNLLAISSTGAGYDVIDVEACTAAGIIVCNQTGSNKEAVAEHTLGFMLSLSKKIGLSDRGLRQTGSVDRYNVVGNDLYGKTVGLIGLGHIGTRVAQLCKGLFGMTVLAYDPYLTAETVAQRGARKAEFEELLALADFVSVHCPRNDETFGMLGHEQFALMKPTTFFITTARGGIVKEDELADALSRRQIAGAALDVFLKEPPPPDHPLLAFETVIATPHIAGMTQEAMQTMAAYAAEQWVTIFRGMVPPRLVNPKAWPLYADRFEKLLGFRPQSLSTPAMELG
jgi:D-3-phosphoglycerate dehydrogenase